VDSVFADAEDRLRDLRVEVRVVPEVEPRFRFANKLAMFDGEAREETDLLVALDSDIVVAGDFSGYLEPAVVQAKQPDGDLLTLELWRRIFECFDLGLPPERYPTHLRPHWTHAYFSTGVVLAPAAVLRPLHDRWLDFIRAPIDVAPTWPDLVEHMQTRVPYQEGATADDLEPLYYAEQWAFSLALRDLRTPYSGLGPTGYAQPDRAIRRVNAAIGDAVALRHPPERPSETGPPSRSEVPSRSRS
jgi:hypothetical protein